VKINAQRTPSAAFNLLQAQIDGQNVTTLRGDGALLHKGDVHIRGGVLSVQGGAAPEGDADMGEAATAAATVSGSFDCHDMQGSCDDFSFLTSPRCPCHLSQIKSTISGDQPQQHIAAYHNNQRAFSVSAQGDAHIAGTLHVGNASLTVVPQLITGQNLLLHNTLHVVGSANVEESLTIGAGFALTPGGMTVDVATHTGTLFELRSRQAGFNGTLMELNSVGDNNVLIKTVSSGLTTFELLSSGDVRMNGLRLASGGVQVQAGGIEVSVAAENCTVNA
jgi:hypothetical protein